MGGLEEFGRAVESVTKKQGDYQAERRTTSTAERIPETGTHQEFLLNVSGV